METATKETKTEFFGGDSKDFEDAASAAQTTQEKSNLSSTDDVFLGFDKKKPDADGDEGGGKETTTKTPDAGTPKVDEEPEKEKTEKPKEPDTTKKEKEKKAEDSKDKKDKKKSDEFKVSFGDKKEETPATTTSKKEAYEVSEADVVSFLNKQGNFDNLKNTSDLSIKANLPEAVEQFKKFNEETGRGIEAYYMANKDWSKEDKDEVIRQHLRLTNPNATDNHIDKKLGLLKLSEDEREALTEREVQRADLEYDDTYANALTYMQDFSKRYSVPKESLQQNSQEGTPEQMEKLYGGYWKRRNASLKDMNNIKLSVEGVGDINIPIDKEDHDAVVEITTDAKAFFARWADEGVINTDKLVMDAAWSIPNVREKFISAMLEQMQVLTLESLSSKNRNVKLDKVKDVHQFAANEENKPGLYVDGETADDRKSAKMGQPLIR